MAEPTLFANLKNVAIQKAKTLDLLGDYVRAVLNRWNDIFYLSIPTMPFVAWWYLGDPPMSIRIVVFIWVFVVAGYYAWRTDHLRLMPRVKFADPPFCFHDQSTDEAEERRYLQVIPECLTDAPVDGCHGYLQRIMKLNGSKWVATQYDHAIGLMWSFQKQFAEVENRTLYKGVEQRINVAFLTNSLKFGIETAPQNMAIKSLDTDIFRFDIHIVAKDCVPLDVSLKVELATIVGESGSWKDALIVEKL